MIAAVALFLTMAPFLWLSRSLSYLSLRATEGGHGLIRGRRRLRSQLLGHLPVCILRAFLEDARDVLRLAAWLYRLLSVNWPLRAALRLANGATRTRQCFTRAIGLTVATACLAERLLSRNWPLLLCRRLALGAIRLRRLPYARPPPSPPPPIDLAEICAGCGREE